MAKRIPLMERLKMAWHFVVNGEFGPDPADNGKNLEIPLDRNYASALVLLAELQREGHFIDFIQQDAARFSNEDIGVAARLVHRGCRRTLSKFCDLAPAIKGEEGSPITVPAGFNADLIRLTGNVRGRPPFRGMLTHHGWVARDIRLPDSSDGLDPRVVAPAEIELP